MTEYDALVVGAGVAGSATALELLSAGWRVGILHQHDKVSAIESLSPSAARSLQRLSIQTGSALTEIIAWWGSEREARAIQSDARIVLRSALADAVRGRAIERGAVVIEGRKLPCIERYREGWLVTCEAERGSTHRLTVKYLIDGTGRASAIGRRLGARRMCVDELFCISMSVHEPGLLGTWTESSSEGWWNLCCMPEEGTLSFYSTAGRIRKAKRYIAAGLYDTRHLQHLLPAPTLGNSRVRACGSSRLIPCAGPGWVSVGDAAAALQPLASAGVSKALRDALMVRDALEHGPAAYDRFQASEFQSYVRQLIQHYALEKRWSKSPFWTARLLPTPS